MNYANSLVFFEEGGKTYFGFSRCGQFIEYKITRDEPVYGYSALPTLTLSAQVYQDSPDDVMIGQRKLAIMCIAACLKKYGNLVFSSSLYKDTVNFSMNDDLFDIDEKLQVLAQNFGGGKIY